MISDGLWDLGLKSKFVLWMEINPEQLFSYEWYGTTVLSRGTRDCVAVRYLF